jgi:hypothetical protein
MAQKTSPKYIALQCVQTQEWPGDRRVVTGTQDDGPFLGVWIYSQEGWCGSIRAVRATRCRPVNTAEIAKLTSDERSWLERYTSTETAPGSTMALTVGVEVEDPEEVPWDVVTDALRRDMALALVVPGLIRGIDPEDLAARTPETSDVYAGRLAGQLVSQRGFVIGEVPPEVHAWSLHRREKFLSLMRYAAVEYIFATEESCPGSFVRGGRLDFDKRLLWVNMDEGPEGRSVHVLGLLEEECYPTPPAFLVQPNNRLIFSAGSLQETWEDPSFRARYDNKRRQRRQEQGCADPVRQVALARFLAWMAEQDPVIVEGRARGYDQTRRAIGEFRAGVVAALSQCALDVRGLSEAPAILGQTSGYLTEQTSVDEDALRVSRRVADAVSEICKNLPSDAGVTATAEKVCCWSGCGPAVIRETVVPVSVRGPAPELCFTVLVPAGTSFGYDHLD